MEMVQSLEITCPCCEALIVIEATTGEILMHKAVERKGKRSLEEMVSDIDRQKSDRDKLFDKVLESQKNRKDILDARFREVMERADKEDDKPRINPLDLD